MNKLTIARQIRFAMSRLTGDEAWTVAGSFGNALASLELGDTRFASWNYSQGRRYLNAMLKRGKFLPGA